MSGFWLKWEKGLTRKPEILQISARLHLPPAQAAGTLMLLMEWLDDSVLDPSEDGHARVRLLSLNPDFIDGLVGVSGFAETLIEVGWLRSEEGELVFVNAAKHNGISAKRRALDADRKKKERSSEGCPAQKRTQSGRLCSGSDSAKSGGKGAGEGKSPAQLRSEALFRKRVNTPWDRAEQAAWVKGRVVVEAATEDEWKLLEWWYALPVGKAPYRRRSLPQLLNNWNAEIVRAKENKPKDGAFGI